MFRLFSFVISLFLFQPIAQAVEIEDKGYQQMDEYRALITESNCTMAISFGSYAWGTDHDTEKAVRAYVASEDRIAEAFSVSWGREGESTLCLKIPDHNHVLGIGNELDHLIPEQNSDTPPTRIQVMQ